MCGKRTPSYRFRLSTDLLVEVSEHEWKVLDGKTYFTDLTVLWSVQANNESLTLSAEALRSGSYVVSYTATDDRGNSGTDTLSVDVPARLIPQVLATKPFFSETII